MKLLIFLATYNEDHHIKDLINNIIGLDIDSDILIIDDSSDSKYFNILEDVKFHYRNIRVIKRPKKLGIGSAHKYAIIYAIENNYDYLLTMDADFSHQPESIPILMKAFQPNSFVTGSRYCMDGKCDYSGYRKYISYFGNLVAKYCLGININEFTTLFRVYDVKILSKIPLKNLPYGSYSFGFYIVYYLNEINVNLIEVPIHFMDRRSGISKVPKHQILLSIFDLGLLIFSKLFLTQEINQSSILNNKCGVCGEKAFLEDYSIKYFHKNKSQYDSMIISNPDRLVYHKCLHCWHNQIPADRHLEIVQSISADDFDSVCRKKNSLYMQKSINLINKALHSGTEPKRFLRIEMPNQYSYDTDILEHLFSDKKYLSLMFEKNIIRFDSNFIYEDNLDPTHKKYSHCFLYALINYFNFPNDLFGYVSNILDKDGIFFFFAVEYNSMLPKYIINNTLFILGCPPICLNADHINLMLEKHGLHIEAFTDLKYSMPIDYLTVKLFGHLKKRNYRFFDNSINVISKYFTIPFPFIRKRLYFVKKV